MRLGPGAWRTQKTLEVLKILLDAHGEPVPADRIGDLVWPGSDGDDARTSVQVAIRSLRTALEPGLRRGERSLTILTTGSAYRVAADRVELDVTLFAQWRDAALAAERRGDFREAAAAARRALALYRGDYLAGDQTADWALATRERLHEQYIALVASAASWLSALGEADEAASWLERALSIDPLREELYAGLMRVHISAGRPAHVALVYERAARVLASALDVEPSPSLRALRARGMGVAPERTAARPPAPQVVGFVGRERELAALRSSWDEARRTSGRVVRVVGSAGAGKTRLVRELATSVEREAVVLWAACAEHSEPVSLAPVREAIAILRDAAAVTVRSRVDEALARLATARDVAERAELVVAAVRELAGQRRVLLVIDDLHWSDRDTVVTTGYLAHRLAGSLVVATQRSDEAVPDTVTSFVDRARTDGRLMEVEVGSLHRDDVAALVRASLPDASQNLVDRVYAATRGHALFVLELVRSLADVGPGALDRVPETLRAAIAARVGRLPDAARDTLCAAAVIGGPFRADTIAMARAVAPDDALASLDTLLERGLVAPSDDGRGYVVAHPLVQRAVYEGLAPGRRVRWHRAIADALSGAHADQPDALAAERLRHLVAAGAPWPEIADAGSAAGDHAIARHSFADARRALSTARDALAERLPDPEVRRRLADIRERIGDSYAGLHQADEALEAYDEVLADSALPLATSARIRRKKARVLASVKGRFREALALLGEAEQQLGDADAVERAEIACARASILADHVRGPETLRAADAALEQARALGLDALVDDVLIDRASTLESIGRLDDAERLVREALVRARSRGDRLREADLHLWLGSVWNRRGKLREALAMHERARELRREAGHVDTAIELANYGVALVPLGELARSKVVLTEALDRARAIGDTYQEMWTLAVLGRTLHQLGALGEAREACERAVTMADEMGNQERAAFARVRLAETALAEGDLATALRRATEALAIGERTDDTLTFVSGHRMLSEHARLVGDHAAAVRHAEIAVARAVERGYRRAEATTRVALVEALWAAGRAPEARAEMARVLEQFRSTGDAYERARALHAFAVAGIPGRKRDRERMLGEALALAKQIGAAHLAGLIARGGEVAVSAV